MNDTGNGSAACCYPVSREREATRSIPDPTSVAVAHGCDVPAATMGVGWSTPAARTASQRPYLLVSVVALGHPTRDTVLAALRRREHELGRPPAASEMNAPGPGYPTLTIVLRKLGSWSEACGALGWSIQPSGSRGDQPVLAAIRVAGWELPGPLTEEAFETLARQRGLPTARTAINRFGSWSNAKRAASAAARGKVHVWSEDEIIAALHAADRELGRPPTRKEWTTLAPKRTICQVGR